MKRILLGFYLLIILSLCSCIQVHKITNYFPKKTLNECMVSDLIKPINAKKIEAPTKYLITYETDIDSFNEYVEEVYEYLKSKDLVLGYQGEVIRSFFGGMPRYAFYLSECLEDHINHNYYTSENSYLFVYGSSIDENNSLIDDVELYLSYGDGIASMHFRYYRNTIFSYTYIENRAFHLDQIIEWPNSSNIISIKKEYVTKDYKYTCISTDERDFNLYLPARDIYRKFEGSVENNWKSTSTYTFEDGSEVTFSRVDGCYLLYEGVYYQPYDGGYEESYLYDNEVKYYDTFEYTILDDTYHIMYNNENKYVGRYSFEGMTFIRVVKPDELSLIGYNSTLWIYEGNIFRIDRDYYKVISEKDFSYLELENHVPIVPESEMNKIKEEMLPYEFDFFLGEYSGYYIWFKKEDNELNQKIEINGNNFEYYSGFSIIGYKDGIIYDLDFLFESLLVSNVDVFNIHNYYVYALNNGLI